MRWRGMRQSSNIEDRRGVRPRTLAGGGAGLLVILILSLLFGVDPMGLLQSLPQQSGTVLETTGGDFTGSPAEEELKQFVATVLASTEDVWSRLLVDSGRPYVQPRLVLFTEQVQSACGFATSAVGPFYCPGDSRVYLDMSFFNELDRRLEAPGDFAQAYVIAHEIGHHVQNLLGISDQVHRARGTLSEAEANALSVRLELQADYFAGVWAHHAQRTTPLIEPGDFDEAIRAAGAIGDDRLQRRAQGYVVPDSFTHGTSEQRIQWFRLGFLSGDPSKGDTFTTADP